MPTRPSGPGALASFPTGPEGLPPPPRAPGHGTPDVLAGSPSWALSGREPISQVLFPRLQGALPHAIPRAAAHDHRRRCPGHRRSPGRGHGVQTAFMTEKTGRTGCRCSADRPVPGNHPAQVPVSSENITDPGEPGCQPGCTDGTMSTIIERWDSDYSGRRACRLVCWRHDLPLLAGAIL